MKRPLCLFTKQLYVRHLKNDIEFFSVLKYYRLRKIQIQQVCQLYYNNNKKLNGLLLHIKTVHMAADNARFAFHQSQQQLLIFLCEHFTTVLKSSSHVLNTNPPRPGHLQLSLQKRANRVLLAVHLTVRVQFDFPAIALPAPAICRRRRRVCETHCCCCCWLASSSIENVALFPPVVDALAIVLRGNALTKQRVFLLCGAR